VKGRLLTEFGRASFESFCPYPTKCEVIFEKKIQFNEKDTLPEELKRGNVYFRVSYAFKPES